MGILYQKIFYVVMILLNSTGGTFDISFHSCSMKIGGVSILAVLNFHRIHFTPALDGVRPNLATSVIRAGINGTDETRVAAQ